MSQDLCDLHKIGQGVYTSHKMSTEITPLFHRRGKYVHRLLANWRHCLYCSFSIVSFPPLNECLKCLYLNLARRLRRNQNVFKPGSNMQLSATKHKTQIHSIFSCGLYTTRAQKCPSLRHIWIRMTDCLL